jgi:hydroxymethylglutaryl-CoA synthase
MVIGTDKSQAAPRGCPGGELDQFVGYGSAAYIFGQTRRHCPRSRAGNSSTSDTQDFGDETAYRNPMHGGRFTGDPSLPQTVRKAASKLMEQSNLKASDLNYFVPHQPNPSSQSRIAKDLGFQRRTIHASHPDDQIRHTYSGASLIGLAAILNRQPDERILVTSYGSGAGSDAYIIRTASQILDKRKRQKVNNKFLAENPFVEYVDYSTYRRLKQGM